jgi:hypothetical protein
MLATLELCYAHRLAPVCPMTCTLIALTLLSVWTAGVKWVWGSLVNICQRDALPVLAATRPQRITSNAKAVTMTAYRSGANC